MQVGILLVCAIIYYQTRMPIYGLLFVFLVMQMGAIVGAWWGAKLKRRVLSARNELPLSRR
jgi:uncharacterized membrane protein YfcA